MGVPQVIPGRVELADLDEGGLNVAFFADHHRDNAVAQGYSPISGDDYRPGDLGLPNICKTNGQNPDHWEGGGLYPSEEDPNWYYIGYAHTVDWVRVTVNVEQAGTYSVSSNWACANPQCGLSLWFNDGTEPMDDPEDGVNKSGNIVFEGTNDYHIWRAYPDFATVELSQGLQLLTFNLEQADHLQYGFLQFDLISANGPGPSEGTGGMGGESGLGGVPATGDMGLGGDTGLGGMVAVGTPMPDPTLMPVVGGDMPATPTAPPPPTTGVMNDADQAGGCAVALKAPSKIGLFGWLLFACAGLAWQRRRRF
jgi:hypothetical protein